MVCYLVRHGKDDETIRGGWSQHPLTEEGIAQAEALAHRLFCDRERLSIGRIYSSDLKRAMQTAQIIADQIHLPVTPLPQFRETNNGDLAGMKNSLALERYPGLFWNRLGWEQCYPNGESPRLFYERIDTAWRNFSQEILSQNGNVLLITHGGVMQVLLSIIEGKPYSNSSQFRQIGHGELIALAYQDGVWKELSENGGIYAHL